VADCLNVERSGFDVAPGPSTRVASAGPDEGRCPTLRLKKSAPAAVQGTACAPVPGFGGGSEDQKDQVCFFGGSVSGGQLLLRT
jgi:hypothetical protein